MKANDGFWVELEGTRAFETIEDVTKVAMEEWDIRRAQIEALNQLAKSGMPRSHDDLSPGGETLQ